MNNLPLYFVENKNQVDKRVSYLIKFPSANIYFTPEAIVYQFSHATEGRKSPEKSFDLEKSPGLKPGKVENIFLNFIGANKGVKIDGLEESGTKVSYFLGNDPSKWVSGAPACGKLRYRDLFPGIDLIVYGKEGKIKNEYCVKPGADVREIKWHYEGAKGVIVNEKGQLEIRGDGATLREDAPLSYQIIEGRRIEVPSEYEIDKGDIVRFKVGPYREAYGLIIDPALDYSTFLGGNNRDAGYRIAVNVWGYVHVVGGTDSNNFPTTAGAYDTSLGGSADIFVSCINPKGTGLLYSTYLGGDGLEPVEALAVAVDTSGNTYLTGMTSSSNFPTTLSAYDTSFNGGAGGYDAFVTKINSLGTGLEYSTYLGSDGIEAGLDIVIDSNRNAYIAGVTYSSNFPTTSGAYDTSFNGVADGFVTKINNTGSNLIYSTYLGGTNSDYARAIAVDKYGRVYVTGETQSSDFPTVPGDYDTTYHEENDVFVSKINELGNNLDNSTYLGGKDDDRGYAICVDQMGNYYVTGTTNSTDFPTSYNAYDKTVGYYDAFVAQISPAGRSLLYSTYLGGDDAEDGYGIAVDAAGNMVVAGRTDSTDFPTTSNAFDKSYNGDEDVFVTEFNFVGSSLLYSTYLGGAKDDMLLGMAMDKGRDIYVAGGTKSSDFPTTLGAYDTSLGGTDDAFISKLGIARDDFLGTWDTQGTYLRDSDTAVWSNMASPAGMITAGDLDYDWADDLIGVWPSQGGVWVKYSASKTWAKLSATAKHIAAGDMSGDGRDDFLGTWDGQGVFYEDSDTGTWVKMASPATLVTVGDLDGDTKDDLIGVWPSQGGVWVKYSSTGAWSKLSSTARDIASGDMNGDGRDDLLATWDGQGVFYRNSLNGSWVKMATPADQVTCGDINGDGVDDLIGIWAGQGGVWAKHSSTGSWVKLASTAKDIATGKMRSAEAMVLGVRVPFPGPQGGYTDGPESLMKFKDLSKAGPGGSHFSFQQEPNLIPQEKETVDVMRIPGPEEPNFRWIEEKNLVPQESLKESPKNIFKR
jgi:hypothetical protein